MAEVPQGYRDIPEEDRKKATTFFERAKTVGDTGNFDFAIEMYLCGLEKDPQNIDAHQALRDTSLKRKASGGKDLGMFEKMKLRRPTKDDKQNLLNAEKLLSYDPGNTDAMVSILQNAHRAGFYDSVLWMGPILQKANADSRSPDFNKFIILRDIYRALELWKEATDACHYAAAMRPNDMDLQTDLKNLGAQHTMSQGNYASAKTFRGSMANVDAQMKLMDEGKDVRTEDQLLRAVREAEAEWQADPEEPGKLNNLVQALERTEMMENENRALELLEQAFERTKQFRFRRRIGEIKMTQLRRMERSMQAALDATPKDESLRKDCEQFRKDRLEFELHEYRLWAEAYPTDMNLRYQIALRLFDLKQYQEAIPVFQQARQDPKFQFEAGLLLGQAFYESGFIDEAIETLQGAIDSYQLRGDDRSKKMHYWQGRALEDKKERDAAIKRYSQVAQWDFNYADVQERIKRLRSGG